MRPTRRRRRRGGRRRRARLLSWNVLHSGDLLRGDDQLDLAAAGGGDAAAVATHARGRAIAAGARRPGADLGERLDQRPWDGDRAVAVGGVALEDRLVGRAVALVVGVDDELDQRVAA